MTDVAPMLGLQYRKRCVIRFIPARSITSVRLIRGSGTRYVAVDVPLAKLGLTKCPEAGGAFERLDNSR